jgi:hypothetical protein
LLKQQLVGKGIGSRITTVEMRAPKFNWSINIVQMLILHHENEIYGIVWPKVMLGNKITEKKHKNLNAEGA